MANVVLNIIWDVYEDYTIRDIHPKTQPIVLDYMMSRLHSSKVMKLLQMDNDSEMVDDIKVVFQNFLQNESSVLVLDKENAVKGVALCCCMTKEWKSWTALKLLNTSAKMKELVNIIITGVKEHNLNNPDDPLTDSLHIFYYKLEPELQNNFCFMKKFFHAISEVGRHMKLPCVSMLSFINAERNFLEKLHFQESAHIIYSMYIHNGRRPFDKLRDMDEMYASLYLNKLEPLIHYEDFIIRHPHLMIKETKRKPERRSVQPVVVEPEAPPDDDE